MLKKVFALTSVFVFFVAIVAFAPIQTSSENILSHTVDLKKQDLRFFWKDDKGNNIKNFKQLKKWTSSKSETLVFAMNGGMYQKDLSPQGLYIENGIVKSKMNRVLKAYGNFYMQPNGVFYITNKKEGVVCRSTDFKNEGIKYATQSGPMLLIDGAIHPKFRAGSNNLNIRNGVGILPNGEILFAMSKEKINFYDFATYFKSQGCKNALYLDGFVSKSYLPSQNWTQLDGNFGVIIAEIKK